MLCCLGWGTTFPESFTIKTRLDGTNKEFTLDDVLSRGLHGLLEDLPQDLPADLANIDVEAVLPKLSTLPLGSKEYAKDERIDLHQFG